MSTTINPLISPTYGNQYYQLPGQSQSSGATNLTPQDLGAQLLSQVTPSSSPSDAFMLDLSPQAQQFLTGISSTANSAGGGSNIPGAGSGFVLTSAQQQQLDAILAKYKDAPFTQATYEQIQNDLHQAGLAPDQLAMEDKIKSFDPTMMLVDALNGGQTDVSAYTTSDSQEQANSDAYMQQVVKQWQSISTTAGISETPVEG